MKKIILIICVVILSSFANKTNAQEGPMVQIFPVNIPEIKQLEQLCEFDKIIERYNSVDSVVFKIKYYTDSDSDTTLSIRTYTYDNTGKRKINDYINLYKIDGDWMKAGQYLDKEYLPRVIKKSIVTLKNQ